MSPTDRVELTEDEMEQGIPWPDDDYPGGEPVFGKEAVESIVAARVAALTAERDQLKEEVSEYVFEYIPLIAGQRDKAEADLRAALTPEGKKE